MLGEQNLSSTFPNVRFTNIWPFCGLFGLYGLEGQTKGIAQILNTSRLQLGEKKIFRPYGFDYLGFLTNAHWGAMR